MLRRFLWRIFCPRKARISRCVLRDASQRLQWRGMSAEQATECVLEFVAYLQTPVSSCRAMWRWVCRAHGTTDWPMRMHWVALEAERSARLPAVAEPPIKEAETVARATR